MCCTIQQKNWWCPCGHLSNVSKVMWQAVLLLKAVIFSQPSHWYNGTRKFSLIISEKRLNTVFPPSPPPNFDLQTNWFNLIESRKLPKFLWLQGGLLALMKNFSQKKSRVPFSSSINVTKHTYVLRHIHF